MGDAEPRSALFRLLFVLSACGSRTDLGVTASGRDASTLDVVGVDDAAACSEGCVPGEDGAVDSASEAAGVDASASTCGGKAGRLCAAGSWCDYGTCDPVLDGEGKCVPVPDDLTNTCPVVCACDGTYYCNAYEASRSGVRVGSQGLCLPATTCNDCMDAPCGGSPRQWCASPDPTTGRSACTKSCQPGRCVERPTSCQSGGAGLCGCDGHAYASSCAVHQAGVDVASSGGVCGG